MENRVKKQIDWFGVLTLTVMAGLSYLAITQGEFNTFGSLFVILCLAASLIMINYLIISTLLFRILLAITYGIFATALAVLSTTSDDVNIRKFSVPDVAIDPIYGTTDYIYWKPDLPPLEFRNGTTFVIRPASRWQIKELCSEAAFACAESPSGVVNIPNPCLYRDDNYARILCHEMGHINGWRHDKAEAE